ncbi:prepilin peptidase-dependent protein [Entomohabitans teleogrylli]|uniref:prepilin peptidase-dependent protein n=1 Tax=Entomohabitans teleogrylli TaxID=1384589 RepID=UPI00073D8809|nr:prepilin peptidase-dependent protein [Entomohabitans teleogrylli]
MNRKQHGFSLPEIMIVLSIVVMLSAAGISGWRSWQQKQQLRHSALLLRDYLHRLRTDANGYNRDWVVQLISGPQGWCLAPRGSGAESCSVANRWQFHPPYQGITCSELTDGIGFFGLRNTAWPGHITLRSAGGAWRVVISVWGRVRLCREEENLCR